MSILLRVFENFQNTKKFNRTSSDPLNKKTRIDYIYIYIYIYIYMNKIEKQSNAKVMNFITNLKLLTLTFL